MILTSVSCDKQNNEVPEGALSFTFEAILADGTAKSFNITSEKAILAEALVDEGLISGENSDYGLYVLTVCDEYHRYEEDGMYWALYVNGEYAMTGISSTAIEDGATYTLMAEK